MKSIEATLVALLAGLAVITQGQAEDYYFYKGPKGELIISNKEPPPGSKIIKRLPGVTDREVPQTQAQEPGKTQPNGQTEGSPKPSKNNSTSGTASYIQSFESSADCISEPNSRRPVRGQGTRIDIAGRFNPAPLDV